MQIDAKLAVFDKPTRLLDLNSLNEHNMRRGETASNIQGKGNADKDSSTINGNFSKNIH